MSSIKKYPVSKNQFNCIGPCYHPSTWIVHPITLEYTTDKNNSFCPVHQWEHVDKNTGKKTSLSTDICYPPTENEDLSGKEFEINILTPNIDFNDAHFLKIYYNIHSFEDAVEFIDSRKYLPILTKLRIMNCALNAYGDELTVIYHRTVNFFIEVVEKLWMNDIYNAVKKYVFINDDKIFFDKPHSNELNKINKTNEMNKINEANESEDERNTIMIFLKNKFVNSDEIYKFIIKYLKYRKDKWHEIKNHINNIKKDFIIYIEQKIKLTLQI